MVSLPLLLLLTAGGPPGPASPPATLDLIEARIEKGEYEAALAELKPALVQAEKARDPASLARATRLQADVYYYQDKREEMRTGYERALALYESLGDEAGIGRCYYSLAYYHEHTRPEEMASVLEKAALHARRAGDRRLEMNVENARGQALNNAGRYAQALERFRLSAQIAASLGADRGRATALLNVGAAEQLRGRYAEAAENGRAALALFERLESPLGKARALGNLGVASHGAGDLDQALLFHRRALHEYEALGSLFGRSAQLGELASLHASLGEVDESRRLYREALDLALQAGSERRAILLMADLASLLAGAGFLAEAEQHLAEAEGRARRVGDAWLELVSGVDRARLSIQRGDDAAAERLLRRSESLARRLSYANDLGSILVLRAEIEARAGRRSEAIAAYREAIALHATGQAGRFLPRWHGQLARLYERAGDEARARDHYERSLEAMEGLDRLVFLDRTRVALREEVADVYAGYARWTASLGEVERAWGILEAGRVRALRLRLDGGAAWIPEASRDAWARWREVERRVREDEVEPAERQRLLAESAALQRSLAAEAGREARAGAGPGNGEARAASLPFVTGAVTLEYARLEDDLLVFAHAAGKSSYRRVEGAKRLMEDARRFANGAADPGSAEVDRALGASLYQRLLGPELSRLRPRRVVVVPDDALSALPWAALPGPEGRLLVEAVTFSEAPSLLALHQLRQGSPAEAGVRVLSVAATRFQGPSSAAPLDESSGEARLVAGYGDAADLLVDAPESRLKAMPLSTYGIVHFASHARTDERRPERSSIVLGRDDQDDGTLMAREIEGLRLSARLVVVSGCRTGGGRFVAGEGVIGLSHALYAAGARAQVLTRWDVTDAGSAAFMEAFYAGLGKLPVGEALREAQLSLRRTERFAHPVHWAGYFVSGDADQRLRLGRRWPFAILVGAGLGLVVLATALGVVVVRRRSRPLPAA